MQETAKFFGSDKDLEALSNTLIAAGFKKHEDNFIRASQSVIPASICFAIATGIASCIKAYLTARGKRMVTRETHGDKIVIKGDFSADEIERLLKIPYSLDIEDDVPPLPGPNRESEMGFHVAKKKKKKKD